MYPICFWNKIPVAKPQYDPEKQSPHQVGPQHPVETGTAGQYSYDLRTGGHAAGKKYNGNKNKQRKKQAPDKGYETEVILPDDIVNTKTGFYKIICLLTGINRYGDYHEKQHAKHKCYEEIFQYVPVYFSHALFRQPAEK